MHNQKGPFAICEALNAYNAQSKRALCHKLCKALNTYNA